jgi:nucleoside-diphosphate-sugar epimerase
MVGSLRQKRALVTGATGYLGSRVAIALLNSGWHVEAIIRPGSSTHLLKPCLDRLPLHVHNGSAEEMRVLMAAARPDVVFHLAALTMADHETSDVDALVGANVLFSTQLVEAMDREGIRLLVNTETFWQHYRGSEDYSAVCLYAATKQAFRSILEWYCDIGAVDAICLLLYDTYGPDDPRPKLLGSLKKAIQEDRPVDLTRGEQKLIMLHVDDVARAYLGAAETLLAGQHSGLSTYGVHDQGGRTLRDLIALIETTTRHKLKVNWGGKDYRIREVMTPWLCPTLPGWVPQIDLAVGLADFFSTSPNQVR